MNENEKKLMSEQQRNKKTEYLLYNWIICGTEMLEYLPKKRDSTVVLRVEGSPEGPSVSTRLRLRGFGSSGS